MLFVLLLCTLLVDQTFGKPEAAVRVLRSYGNEKHPNAMQMQIRIPGKRYNTLLNMQKAGQFSDLAMTVSENGKRSHFKSDVLKGKRDFAQYTDAVNNAVFNVENDRRTNQKRFYGHFENEGNLYSLSPTKKGGHAVGTVDKKLQTTFKRLSNKRSTIKKRQSSGSTTYVVELMLALDWTVWNFFINRNNNDETEALTELKWYYSYVMLGMDTAYRNIQSFSISLSCVNVFVAKTAVDSPWFNEGTTANPDANDILNRLIYWIPESGIKADHYMAFTRTDLVDSDGSTAVAGLATMSGVCDGAQSVSVNEDHGLTSAWMTGAHELGHCLGADHDGEAGCDPNSGYLMRSINNDYTMSTLPNAYKFSRCAEESMLKTIQELPSNCLTTNEGQIEQSEYMQSVQPGKTYTADKLCQLLKPNSLGFYATTANEENPETICAAMYCKDADNEYSGTSIGPAPVGVLCGNQKICTIKGTCDFDASAAPKKEGCFYGDKASKEECNEMKSTVNEYPEYKEYYCEYIKDSCCSIASEVCSGY